MIVSEVLMSKIASEALMSKGCAGEGGEERTDGGFHDATNGTEPHVCSPRGLLLL